MIQLLVSKQSSCFSKRALKAKNTRVASGDHLRNRNNPGLIGSLSGRAMALAWAWVTLFSAHVGFAGDLDFADHFTPSDLATANQGY
ncbi:MAG: hypothetical protein AAGA18_14455, partial [Verrucomicrobiota bacterium]